ncbi:hypothetical protein [Halobacteriovorax sp. JY17]|nr:hypothetical protein [Halobacteriovorax sp. JY17]
MEIVIVAGIIMGSLIAVEIKKREEQEKSRVPVKVKADKREY